MDTKHKIEIIICTESGYLELLSRLLVTSLRSLDGFTKDVPIYSYQPRTAFKVSDQTKLFFEENEVHHIDLPLNSEFKHYPLANKPLACAHRERHSKAETLVFLDSDTFFLKTPDDFLSLTEHDVMLRSVDNPNIGTTTKDDNFPYWQSIYKLLGVNNYRYVHTTVDNVRILEYYNSGHIVSRRNIALYQQWNENFRAVMKQGFMPQNHLFFVEQSVFSATVSQQNLRVAPFSNNYNYPVHLEGLPNNRCQVSDWNDLVSLHHHNIFKNKEGINPLKEKLNLLAQGRVINTCVEKHNLVRKI